MIQKLQEILKKCQALEQQLTQEQDPKSIAELSKEYSRLEPLVYEIKHLFAQQAQLKDLEAMEGETDPELVGMIQQERQQLNQEVQDRQQNIQVLLLPTDPDDARNAIVEIRAGTGGDEAALFAADLMRMYMRYANSKNWTVEVLDTHSTEQNGIKEAGLLISGKDVFANLKFEAGVHRVQRVPKTEASGRIHTSAATVAILPEVEEVDIVIEEKDIRIDVFRSSGPGGQSVNTTDSAVRITHIPTGIVVSQQDEKSQHKNKAKALKILRSRIYEAQREEKEQERSASRQSQVGRGDRSERIRTYNFPQGRLTDHRIKLTLYKLDEILEGSGLEEVVQALITFNNLQQMAEVKE